LLRDLVVLVDGLGVDELLPVFWFAFVDDVGRPFTVEPLQQLVPGPLLDRVLTLADIVRERRRIQFQQRSDRPVLYFCRQVGPQILAVDLVAGDRFVGGYPQRCPEVPTPPDLHVREVLLVSVIVDAVGIHAHPQFVTVADLLTVRPDKPGLQANRQQRQRLVVRQLRDRVVDRLDVLLDGTFLLKGPTLGVRRVVVVELVHQCVTLALRCRDDEAGHRCQMLRHRARSGDRERVERRHRVASVRGVACVSGGDESL